MGSGARALVLGEVDLVRALGLAGIRSIVVAHRGSPVRFSRHSVAAIDRIDPWADPDGLVELLLRVADAEREPPVLYYDNDSDLLLVSRHRDRLAGAYRFVVPEADLVEDLVDKVRFQALAARIGMPVPRAAFLPAGADVAAGLDLRFPVLVKPLTRRHATWRPLSRAKAIHVDAPATLIELSLHLSEAGVDVLVQEVVPGPETEIESYHVYVDHGGDVGGEFTGKKLRTYPEVYGYSTALLITDSADVAATGRELVLRLGLRGVAKLDFKRDPDGRLQLLEVNPRFNLWHHPGALAGVNLPELVYGDLLGLPRRRGAAARAGVRWCSPVRDAQAARADGISSLRWLASMLRYEAKSGFAWDDPLPLLAGGLWRATRFTRRARRSARASVAPAGR